MSNPLDEPGETVAWQPATSRPGEVFTVEGRIEAVGAFARGLKHRDPRGSAYRRSMLRTAAIFVGIGVAVSALLVLVT